MGWDAVTVVFIFSLLPYCGKGVYTFEGNPFQQNGTLDIDTITLDQLVDGVPLHTEVFYPTNPGSYTPILFIPGLKGIVYPGFYSTVMTKFASYGYVVAGIDPYWPAAVSASTMKDRKYPHIIKADAQKAFTLLQWLKDHLDSEFFPAKQVYNVTIDWSKLGILSHSAGADTLVLMLKMNSTFAKAAAFLEPYSTHLKSPLISLPSLSYGTEMCMEFPTCCIKGLSYLHFYQNLRCPRIQLNVMGYGHCDMLNEVPGWELCHVSGFCKTDRTNNRNLYREVFVPGVLSCFFGQYLQNSHSSPIKLITNADYMPVRVSQLESELNCL